MDSKELAKLVDFGTTHGFGSLLVVRHGKMVAEAYYAPGIPHTINSCTKSVISTLTAIAFKDGLLDSLNHRVLDQYESSPPEGWPRWMDREIGKAQFVLMICTERYYRRVMGTEKPGVGLGIAWEGSLIYNQIYKESSLNTKFIPVIFDPAHAQYIPAPLQGATRYCLDHEYEKLYKRLIGKPPAEKPPLGKRKPLPEREVKTNVAMLLSFPVDFELWDRANWRATVFMVAENGDGPPVLGLGFVNEDPARQIFRDWRERYGPRDKFEELRVSVIEGEIPRRAPGYSVHVGADPENVFRRYKELGLMADGDLLAVNSRINRMNAPNSPKLAGFKEAYGRFKSYFLAPVLSMQGE
jgi:hypothetical protein